MLEFLMEILCSTRLNLEYLSIILHLFFKYIFKTLVIGESREYLGHVLCMFSVGSGLDISEGWDVVGFDGVEPMDAGKAQSGMENLGTFVVKG